MDGVATEPPQELPAGAHDETDSESDRICSTEKSLEGGGTPHDRTPRQADGTWSCQRLRQVARAMGLCGQETDGYKRDLVNTTRDGARQRHEQIVLEALLREGGGQTLSRYHALVGRLQGRNRELRATLARILAAEERIMYEERQDLNDEERITGEERQDHSGQQCGSTPPRSRSRGAGAGSPDLFPTPPMTGEAQNQDCGDYKGRRRSPTTQTPTGIAATGEHELPCSSLGGRNWRPGPQATLAGTRRR